MITSDSLNISKIDENLITLDPVALQIDGNFNKKDFLQKKAFLYFK